MKRGNPCAWPLVAVVLVGAAPTGGEAGQPLAALAPIEIYADGFQEPGGIAVDASGHLYVADSKAGTITRVAPGLTPTVVLAGLDHPAGVAFDTDGRLLVAEEHAGRVVRLEPNGRLTALATGLSGPRWLAVAADDTLYIAARQTDPSQSPHGAGAAEKNDPWVIVRRDPATGLLTTLAGGLKKLEALALDGVALYAAAKHVSGLGSEGVIVQYPLDPSGTLGPPSFLAAGGLKEPVGLVLDHLGALYVTAKEVTAGGATAREAVGKVHAGGHLSRFAENLEDPLSLALDAEGHLYVAEGKAGRVLRFLAPPAPTLTVPAFTNQSPVGVTGTSEPGARIDVFASGATLPVTATADGTGSFSAFLAVDLNAENTLEAFATAQGGDGLSSTPAVATVVHDNTPPALVFNAPPAGVHVRQAVAVEARASDGTAGVASLALAVDGQSLGAALSPAPPAETVTATGRWDTLSAGDGAHTLTATAADRAQNHASISRIVVVDNTPPETEITQGPTGEISETSAAVSFMGIDNLTPSTDLTFTWRLDSAPFGAFEAATTATFDGLAEGLHTFEVKARDQAGNEDPTPARRTFTVRLGPSIASVEPDHGPAGTLLTITGAGFEPGGTQVAFNGVAAVARAVTPASITTTVPAGATTGPLVVTTARGTASRTFTVTLSGDFSLTATPAPPAPLRLIAGDQASAHILVGGSGSFTGLVSLGVSGGPPGVSKSFSPALVPPGGASLVTFAASSAAPAGRATVTVSGRAEIDGQPVTRTASVDLEVLPPETTAVTGRVLTADAVPQPIPGATVTLGSAFTLTDGGGNFVLLAPPPGANMLLVDGRTASTPTEQYPPVEIQIHVNATGPTRVPFAIYLPRLDTAHPVTLPLDAAGAVLRTVQATTPAIPGLVVTVPQGTRIVGPEGNPVSEITITPVPVDRSPMPFPPGASFPLLFTIQPGGAVPSRPLPITFPNVRHAAPGSKADLYFFDLSAGTWAVWGTGTVSEDGTEIVSDPGFGLPRFAWHSACDEFCLGPPEEAPPADNQPAPTGGDPVDLFTGRFRVAKTDLVLPGRIPIRIERQSWSGHRGQGLFGIGWNLAPWDSRLAMLGTSMVLIQPDQSRLVFAPAGPSQWVNVTAPAMRGAAISRRPGEFSFDLRLKDGAVHRYERLLGFSNVAALAAIVDRNGNAVTLTREPVAFENHRVTRIAEPAGRAFTLAYDGSGRIVSVTDPIGRAVRYTYDAAGRLETVTDPAGGMTRYAYDAEHRVVSITDARGITFVANEYDAAGRVVRQTQADGGVWWFAYQTRGSLVAQTVVTDPRGNPTTYRFNAQGFALARTDALGQTTIFEYEPGSNLLRAVTDPLGRATRFAWDERGNVLTVTDAAGGAWSFTYEPTFSQVTSATDPLGNATRFEYDARGNLAALADPLGARTTFAYDPSGQLTSRTDALGNVTTFIYDADGNLATIRDPVGHETRREHDRVSRLIREVDPRGASTVLLWDALNRVTAISDALGGAARFTYDPNGNLLTATDARGGLTTFTYDAMDRLSSRADPLGAVEMFAYDGLGNLVTHTNRRGQVARFTYDSLNRRVSASYADGATTAFVYDAAGRLLEATGSDGGAVRNGWDPLDRLVAQSTALGTVSYEYDALGRRTGLNAPGQPPTVYEYDAASRLTRIAREAETVTLVYDAAGRRIRLDLPNGVSTHYQYDPASRLVGMAYMSTAGPLGDLAYEYDAAGRRIALGGSFARTLLPDAVASATYDTANRQLTFGPRTLAWDADGNLVSVADPSGVTGLAWDARDRLRAIAAPAATARYAYDPLGRRRRKELDGVSAFYLYDGRDVLQEVGRFEAVAYLRTPAADEPLGRGEDEFVLADALGSVLGLTDASGLLTTRYAYDPFGRTAVEGLASENAFRFTAREEDLPGLYFYRARYYAPELHRFLSEDPLPSAIPGRNPYSYARNNPLIFVDPYGTLDVDKIVTGSLMVAGGVTAISTAVVVSSTGVGAGVGISLAIVGASTGIGGGVPLIILGLMPGTHPDLPPISLEGLAILIATGGDVELARKVTGLIQAGRLARNILGSLDELIRTGQLSQGEVRLILNLIQAERRLLRTNTGGIGGRK